MHSGFFCMNGNFLSRQRERLRGAAAGRENLFVFLIQTKPETSRAGAENRRKFAKPGKTRGRNGAG
jgi:hypothetical protein